MKKILLACVVAIASLSAQAQVRAPSPLSIVAGIGVTAGGDKLATVYYRRGDDIDIRAGSGLQLHGGLQYRVSQEFALQATAGVHTMAASARNGDADFTRFPVEVLAYYYPANSFRLGGGARFVYSPELDGSGVASNIGAKFKDARGLVLEGEWLWGRNFGVKLRYVREEYEAEWTREKFSGNHVGLFANAYF